MVEERLSACLTCEHKRNLLDECREMGFLAKGTTLQKRKDLAYLKNNNNWGIGCRKESGKKCHCEGEMEPAWERPGGQAKGIELWA